MGEFTDDGSTQGKGGQRGRGLVLLVGHPIESYAIEKVQWMLRQHHPACVTAWVVTKWLGERR